MLSEEIPVSNNLMALRKKIQSDLLKQWLHDRHSRGKLSFHKRTPEEISVFGYLMGPQKEKSETDF